MNSQETVATIPRWYYEATEDRRIKAEFDEEMRDRTWVKSSVGPNTFESDKRGVKVWMLHETPIVKKDANGIYVRHGGKSSATTTRRINKILDMLMYDGKVKTSYGSMILVRSYWTQYRLGDGVNWANVTDTSPYRRI